jgi:PAS domain S-box-containing protein
MYEKQKLLVVDDRPENIVALRQVLSDFDVDIIAANDGNSALAATLDHEFALALLDVMMPHMSGYELAGHLRGDEKTKVMPILFLTASFPDEQSEFKGYEAGAIDYIVKPFAPEVLRGKIKILLELDRHKRELKWHRDHLEALVAERTMALTERVKEVRCLYAISSLVAEPCASIPESLAAAVEMIPPGWQYPECTCARIVYRNQEFKTTNYKKTSWRQAADMAVSGEQVGSVEVCYLEEKPVRDEGPFFKEERELVVDIARQLGVLIHRELAFEALRDSEARYKVLFDGSAEGILVADIQTRKFLYANRAICEMLGYSERELTAMGVSDIHPQDSLEQVIAEFGAQARGEKRLASGIPCLRKDGTALYVDIATAKAVIDGKPCNIGFFLDITERQQLEEQLRQSQKLDAIGQLAGGVAHDFNNQLSAILGYAELLCKRVAGDGKSEQYLSSIATAAMRSADLSRQLLTFARKSGHKTIPVNIHDALREVIEMLKRTIDPRIEIRVDLAAADAIVLGDPTLLQNAFLNIGLNARDAMPEGGVLRIETADCPESRAAGSLAVPAVHVRFADTGIGMSDEIKAKIFDPFFTTKEIGKGTGMGLAAVYGTVTSHGGVIAVESKVGMGSAFVIQLPLDQNKAPDEKTCVRDEHIKGHGRILVVDDEESVRIILKEMLEDLGYSIASICTNGRDAVNYYARHAKEVDLIVIDMLMPKMNGRDAFHEIRTINPHAAGLIVSGYGDGFSQDEFVAMGFYGVLSKPFTLSSLSKSVSEALRNADRPNWTE